VLLQQGRVIASGALQETLARLDLPTAHLDDTGVAIEAKVAEHDNTYHLTRLEFSGGSLWVSQLKQPLGSNVRARVLARDVSVATQSPHGSSISKILNARITEICEEGADKMNLQMTVGETQILLSRITRRSHDLLNLSVGMEVFAQVKSVVLITGGT
jgi:molybdate transport system ATP-binding protein